MVGDEAFQLKNYLLRSYPGAQVEKEEAKATFNYRLSRARRVVENAFGILAQRFRVYRRVLKSQPKYADKIILSTCGGVTALRTHETFKKNFTSDAGALPWKR